MKVNFKTEQAQIATKWKYHAPLLPLSPFWTSDFPQNILFLCSHSTFAYRLLLVQGSTYAHA